MNGAFRVIIISINMLLLATVAISAQGDGTNRETNAPSHSVPASASASNVEEPAPPPTTPSATNTAELAAESPDATTSASMGSKAPQNKVEPTGAGVSASANWRHSPPHRLLTWLASALFSWWLFPLILAVVIAFLCRLRESRRAIWPFLGLLFWHCLRFVFLTGLLVMMILQVFKLPAGVGAFERFAIGIAVAAWIAVGHCIQMLVTSTLRRLARRAAQPKTTLPLVDEVAQQFIMQAEAIHKGEGLRSFIGATRTIALFGEWGSGKSTFLRQLEEKLSSLGFIKPSTEEKQRMEGRVIVPIFFDAWQAQSACPPEFALLNEIYANPVIQCLAWFTKPWYLRWLSLARSLRITIRGLSLDSTTQSGTLRRLELSLLSDAYRVLLDFLQQSGVSLVILIDESDRCDRLYFQGVLNLIPRYLNADNCFVVSAMVDSQFWNRLFPPLNAPESGEALLERYQLLAKEIDVEYAQPDSGRNSGSGKAEKDTSAEHAGDTGQSQTDGVSVSPVPPPAADQQPRIMRVCIKGDGLLERFEPDFYDTLRAAHAAGYASQVDLQRHFLAKFFEQQLFLAPPATTPPSGSTVAPPDPNPPGESTVAPPATTPPSGSTVAPPATTPPSGSTVAPPDPNPSDGLSDESPDPNTSSGASVPDIVNRLVAAWTQRTLPPKDKRTLPVYNDLLELSTFHGGLGANPRLIISALSSVLPLMLSAARSVGYDLSNSEMKDFISLLRLSLGLYCYLDRHPNYIMGLEAADSMRIADMLFAFASPESLARKEAVLPGHKFAKADNQEEKKLKIDVIEPITLLYSEQRSSENLLACQVVFGIGEDVAEQQRHFAQRSKIRSLCNELCRVWTYSRRHLLSDTPADWDLIRVDRAWDVLRSGNPKRAITMFDASIAALDRSSTTPERRLGLVRALRGRGRACSADDRPDEAIAAFDEVIRRFGDSPEPALCEQAAMALGNKGVTYYKAQRTDKAIAAFDEVDQRYGKNPEPALRKLVAMALVSQGIVYGQTNRPNEAIAAYDEVVRRFGDAPEPALREAVAMALVNKGVVYGDANPPR